MTEIAEPEIGCVFCCHDYDSHDVDAADGQRNMPCRDCTGGTCRHPNSASGDPAGAPANARSQNVE